MSAGGKWLRRLAVVPLAVAAWLAFRAVTEPAATDPWVAFLVSGAAGGLLCAMVLWLVPAPGSDWSIRRRDSLGLAIGIAVTVSGLGYGVAYLDEKTLDQVPAAQAIGFKGERVRVNTEAGSDKDKSDKSKSDKSKSDKSKPDKSKPDKDGPESTAATQHTVTVMAYVTSCDDPVTMTAAFWPHDGKELSGHFRWTGAGPVPALEAEELVAAPEDGAFAEFPGAAVAGPEEEGRAGGPAKAVYKFDPLTHDRPVIAQFRLDALERRNGRNGCYLQLPDVTGQLHVRGEETATLVGREVQMVRTGPGVRVVDDESNPSPAPSATGQPAWICTYKGGEQCDPPTAAIEDVRASSRMNLNLVVLGAWIGLGFAIVIQLVLAKLGIETTPR